MIKIDFILNIEKEVKNTMNRNKLLTIGLVLVVLFICVGAVSAADIADDAAALTIDDSADAVAIEDAPAVVEADAATTDEIEQVNENVDENIETLEYSGTSVNADNWTSLRDYSQKTDSNYVITLTGTEYTIGNYIQFRNNATIIGTPGSYITGGSASTIPFIETSTYNKNNVNFINVTFKDINCRMLIQAYTTGTTTIENCTFTNITVGSNHCSVVYNNYGNMNIIGSNFTNCSTSYGAITNHNGDPTSVKMNVADCRFEGNTASSEPGAINNCGIMNVTDSTFIGNHAELWAGAIHTHSNAQTRITGSEFTNNSAVWGGGALFSYSVLEVYDSTFTGNSGLGTNGGGAISGYNFGSTYDLTVCNCTFIENEAVTGGAISVVNGGNLNVCNSTFINNAATTGQAIASATVVVDENSTGSPTTTIENNKFYNHTQNTADTVYITGNNYVCNYNTFNNSYQTPLTGTGNVYVNVPGSSSPTALSNSRILKSARPSDKLGDIETIVVHNNDELYAALEEIGSNEGIIELAAGTYSWNYEDYNFNYGNITFIGQGSETILVSSSALENYFSISLQTWMDDGKIGRNFKNLVIKDAFIEMSNDISFDNVLFDNVTFNIGYHEYELIQMNSWSPSEETFDVTFKNCNFTNTQEVISFDIPQFYDNIGVDGGMMSGLYGTDYESLAGKSIYMLVYPHNDVNIVNCTFSNIALDVLVFSDTDFGWLNIENSVFNDCTYGNFAITKTSTTDYVNINNCWYDSDVVLGFSDLGIFKTAQATDSYAAAQAVQNENVVYDGETLNDFTVKLVSVNAEGVESDFDATGFPSIPVTFTVDDAATEGAFVDGIAKLSIPLTTNQAVIKATVGSKEFTFTLPEMPPVEVESPEINDDNYADYFGADGKILPHVTITDGKVILGDLTNKDIVIDRALDIVAKEGSQLVNCTITLNGDASDSTITGLNFNNFNKNALVIEDGIDNVKIEENQITVNTGEEPSIAAVSIVGYSKNIAILNNIIDMTGDAENLYGICAIAYPNEHYSEANSVVDIRNNNITVTGSNMVEALYLTNIENSVIDNNIVVVSSTGSSDAYGIQVADMSYWASMSTYAPSPFRPPNNINITNNKFTVKGNNMVYGITVISTAMIDMDSDTAISYPESEIIISNNIVDVESAGGVVAIGGQSLTQSEITNNNITAVGGSTDGITTVDAFGVHNAAILLIDDTGDIGSGKECENVEITGNLFFDSAITSIQVETPESATVENNLVISENGAIIVNDDTYQYLFDEEGNFVYETEDGTTILVDVLTNKNMIFAQPLNIKSKDDSSVITNGTITLTADASGSNVTGLNIVLDNVPAATYPGLAVITLDEGIQDVVLEDNSIQWVTADSPANATAMGIKIVGGENGVSSDIKLINNEITISGDAAYMYGIDCYSNPWDYDGAITGLLVKDNMININGPGFVEGIYLSRVTDSKVTRNNIGVKSTGGNVYGVGTDNIHDVNVEANLISATTTAEGKTAAGINLYQSDINEKVNVITVSGATAQEIKSDAKSVVYALVDEDNYDQYFDESGNYNNNAEDITLGDLSNKDLTFGSPVNVKGAPGAKLTDVTIKLTADASGSSIDGLTIVYEGADLSYYHGIIDIMGGAKDIALTNNVINVTATNEDGTAMAIFLSGNIGEDLISNITISGNEINMNGTAKYLYAVDAISNNWGSDDPAVSGIDAYDNNIKLEGPYYVAGFYLSHTTDSDIHDNVINGVSTGADGGVAYGIASDCASKMIYDNNIINLEAASDSSTVWGIQAAPGYGGTPSTDITVTNNDITVTGASAVGVIIKGGNSTIKDNTIDVDAADNETIGSISTDDKVGTGNSGVKLTGNATADVSGNYINSNQNNMDLAGAGSDTKIGTNYVTEYVEKEGNPDLPAAPKATSITVQSATVTADPNGKSKTQNIAITVKDANGNPVAGQTIQVYVNGALKTAKTNDKGVATLAVPYKAGGTVSLVASFNGATGLLGSSATGKLTVKKNAVKIAAKTKKVKKSKAKKAKVKFTLKVGKTALKKKAVTITINKKTYKAKTNAKGIATFKVKLPKKAKKYKYTVKFAGDNFNKAKTFKGKLTVK